MGPIPLVPHTPTWLYCIVLLGQELSRCTFRIRTKCRTLKRIGASAWIEYLLRYYAGVSNTPKITRRVCLLWSYILCIAILCEYKTVGKVQKPSNPNRCNIITIYGTLIFVDDDDDDDDELVSLTSAQRTTTPSFVCGGNIEYTHSRLALILLCNFRLTQLKTK